MERSHIPGPAAWAPAGWPDFGILPAVLGVGAGARVPAFGFCRSFVTQRSERDDLGPGRSPDFPVPQFPGKGQENRTRSGVRVKQQLGAPHAPGATSWSLLSPHT